MNPEKEVKLKKQSEDAEEWYKKGLAHGKNSDSDEAIKAWNKTVELDQNHYEAWYNLGNAWYIGKNNLQRAIECWEQALKIKPDDVDVLYNMGNAYREVKEFENVYTLPRICVTTDNMHFYRRLARGYGRAFLEKMHLVEPNK